MTNVLSPAHPRPYLSPDVRAISKDSGSSPGPAQSGTQGPQAQGEALVQAVNAEPGRARVSLTSPNVGPGERVTS